MDQDLHELARRLRADPEDREALSRCAAAAARELDAAQALRALFGFERWDGAAERQRLAAVGHLSRRLGDEFELVRWATCRETLGSCRACDGQGWVQEVEAGAAWQHYEMDDRYSLKPCGRCEQSGGEPRELAHQTSTFLHRPSGIELNLVPGAKIFPNPFLLGRFVLTRGQAERRDDPWAGDGALPALSPDADALGAVGLRRPQRHEWEHAWRAGTRRTLLETDTPRRCDCAHPHPVTREVDRPSSLGLVELFGNVHEWVEDDRRPGRVGGQCGPDARVSVPPQLAGVRLASDLGFSWEEAQALREEA